MKSTVHFAPNKHLENIGKMFKKLYQDEQLADVTLLCKEGRIRAHKVILATSSPYFHRIFTENFKEHVVVVMHGVSYQTLHNLVELLYRGHVEVPPEALTPLYELAGEFQISGISGVLREDSEKGPECSGGRSDSGLHGRETRFKGLKRVAVDYRESDEISSPKRLEKEDVLESNPEEVSTNDSKLTEESTDGEEIATNEPNNEEPPKLTPWAKKLRKFHCDICPSSFKRSSHLSRHQLVHTGERPYACDQCEKAFSRHDKLKHHIKKAHEDEPEDQPIGYSPPSSPLPFLISHVRSEAVDEQGNPPKRPRGRPRKYPPTPKPLIKRPRGRPRLNPKPEGNGENYDLTNLPYGDLEYLTMPLQEPPVVMEPLVEIKTEKEDKGEEQKNSEESGVVQIEESEEVRSITASLKVLENRIAKIGECTISVANH